MLPARQLSGRLQARLELTSQQLRTRRQRRQVQAIPLAQPNRRMSSIQSCGFWAQTPIEHRPQACCESQAIVLPVQHRCTGLTGSMQTKKAGKTATTTMPLMAAGTSDGHLLQRRDCAIDHVGVCLCTCETVWSYLLYAFLH